MDELAHYPERKCTTPACDHPPRQPRMAIKNSEKIEFCNGYRPTVVWDCPCEWKKMELFHPKES